MRSLMYMTRPCHVLNEFAGRTIEPVHLRRYATPFQQSSWCDAHAHVSHADVHARKMRCQQHRTTRTAPLIDVAAGDVDCFGFAHVRPSSLAAAATCSLCVSTHAFSICYTYINSFTTLRTPPVLAASPHPIEFSSCVQHRPSKKCGPVAEDPWTRRARCAASCGKRAGARWWMGASARSWRRTARTCTTRSGAPSASPPPRISSARSGARH